MVKRDLEFRIFLLLKEYNGLRVGDIASYLGVNYHSAYRAVKMLEKKRYVSKDEMNTYTLIKKVWGG